MLFERMAEGREVHVGCTLDDGTYVRGRLRSFNNSADDAPDRELILGAPIAYRSSEEDEEQEYPVSAVCVAARHVVTLFVFYGEQVTSSLEEVVEGRAPRAVSSILRASDPPVSQAASAPSQC